MDKNTSKLKVYLAMLKGGGDSDDEWEVTAAFTTRDNAQAYVDKAIEENSEDDYDPSDDWWIHELELK